MSETIDERKKLREGLLDQLGHLVREIDMLEGVIARVPEKLLAEAPPDEARSIKETFGLIARLDEAVHPERIRRVAAEDTPRLAPADPEALLAKKDWNVQPITGIFERVRAARQGLIGTLEATPPPDWLRAGLFPKEEAAQNGAAQESDDTHGDDTHRERDLYGMAHALCRRDSTRLEKMTRRLYESHMGPAPERDGTDA